MATNQAQSLNHNSLERFGFSGHETFPFRYGWLKKAVDAVTKNKFLFSTEQALVELGENMVQSIRHWGLATQVLLEGEGRSLEVSPIGWQLFKEWDPHLEKSRSSLFLPLLSAAKNKPRTALVMALYHFL